MSEMPDLESKCLHCEGRGGFTAEEGERELCHDCSGSGFKPTPIGERILKLIRHNSRVTVSAELRVSGAAS